MVGLAAQELGCAEAGWRSGRLAQSSAGAELGCAEAGCTEAVERHRLRFSI
jgi:hypothetical protein